MSWNRIVDEVRSRCVPAGFDLVHAFPVGLFNDGVEPEYRLSDFGRGGNALAVLFANTAALWAPFVAAYQQDTEANPLDRYTERCVHGALEQLDVAHEVVFSHEPPPRRLPMTRLADLSRFAVLGKGRLCVHPTYGPWIALRAVAVFDVDGPEAPELPRVGCDCSTGCGPAFDRAMAAGEPGEDAELAKRWRDWLAVRDACPVGREHRYGDDQIRYHYVKDRGVLGRA